MLTSKTKMNITKCIIFHDLNSLSKTSSFNKINHYEYFWIHHIPFFHQLRPKLWFKVQHVMNTQREERWTMKRSETMIHWTLIFLLSWSIIVSPWWFNMLFLTSQQIWTFLKMSHSILFYFYGCIQNYKLFLTRRISELL